MPQFSTSFLKSFSSSSPRPPGSACINSLDRSFTAQLRTSFPLPQRFLSRDRYPTPEYTGAQHLVFSLIARPVREATTKLLPKRGGW